MNKEIINRILQITAVLVIVAVFVFMFFEIEIFSKKGLLKIPSIIGGIVIFWTFYFTWGWKICFLKKLVYKENLNGTWLGTYKSKDFTSDKKYEGEIVIVIRQTFLYLSVTSYTEKYLNYSFGEALNYDTKNESHQLIYLYSQNQFEPTDDNTRKGTSELNLICKPSKKELFGDFWTNHNSKGYLNLQKLSDEHSKSFEQAKSFLKIKP